MAFSKSRAPKVQANPAIDRLMPRVEWEAQQHLLELFEKKVDPEGTGSEATTSPEEDSTLVDKVNPEQESATVLTPQELAEKKRRFSHDRCPKTI